MQTKTKKKTISSSTVQKDVTWYVRKQLRKKSFNTFQYQISVTYVDNSLAPQKSLYGTMNVERKQKHKSRLQWSSHTLISQKSNKKKQMTGKKFNKI